MPENPNDALWALSGNNPKAVTIDVIRKALDTTDTFIHKIIETYTQLLAVSIANLTLTLDIGLIVFGGDIIQLNDHILKPMRYMLSCLLDYPPAILLSELNNQACIYGAISKGRDFSYQNLY